MSMSAGGNDGLFRLAEQAAPDDHRIMPTERTYLKSAKTVSLNDAISLMKQRREHPEMKIAGGLDDTSSQVRKQTKTPKTSRSTTPHDPIKTKQAGSPDAHRTPSQDVQEDPVTGLLPTSADPHLPTSAEENNAAVPDVFALSTPAKGRITTASLMSGITVLQHQLDQVLRNTNHLQDTKIPSGQADTATTATIEEPEEIQELKRFKAGRHKVTFLINSMEFSVKCLNMVRDEQAHCLVLAFADDADSFFVPPMQSELKIKFDGLEEPGRLFYFGMCFRIKELGLKFLGFLLDTQNEPVDTNGNI